MTHILLINCQEKLYAEIERPCATLSPILQILQSAKLLSIPVTCTEQSPKVLGSILPEVEEQLHEKSPIFSKQTFSCLNDPDLEAHIMNSGQKTWVLIGLKAHISVLQTARDLIERGFNVIVPNDAIGAANLYQLSSAIAEMRDMGARITCTETLLFEWMKSDQHKYFNEISSLLNPNCSTCN